MDFEFSEEQESWRKTVREFVRRECPPEYAQRCDREARPPVEGFRALAKLGWLGVSVVGLLFACLAGAIHHFGARRRG